MDYSLLFAVHDIGADTKVIDTDPPVLQGMGGRKEEGGRGKSKGGGKRGRGRKKEERKEEGRRWKREKKGRGGKRR
jgi:hypothetical protein